MQWWETLTGRPPITPWAYPLWNVWIVVRVFNSERSEMAGIHILLQLLPLAYFGGYVLLPRQLRLERESYIRLPVAEANAQSSDLLQEEEGSEQNTNSV